MQDINVDEVYITSYEFDDLAPDTNYLVSIFNTVADAQGTEVWSVPFSDYQRTSELTFVLCFGMS